MIFQIPHSLAKIMSYSSSQIPGHHFDSLKQIESGYWWYEGRLIWARQFIRNWLERNAFTDPVFYADLGCGTGGFGINIQNNFAIDETILIDNNPEALNRVSANQNITLLNLDLESNFELPFEPNLITCMDVIEHIEQDQKFVDHLFTCIKPGGLLVLSTAAHPFLFSTWDKKLGHYRRYSKSSLVKKLEKSGFKVWHASYGWAFLFPLAPYRFFCAKKQENLDYPKVPNWLNSFLLMLSKMESKLSNWIPYPFGTSVFIAALKE